MKTERYVAAVRLFRMMMKMGIKPSPVSFVIVFPVLSVIDLKNANDYRMLVKMGSEYVNDLFVVSSMIFMSVELGCVDFARKVFYYCHTCAVLWRLPTTLIIKCGMSIYSNK